MSPGLLDYGEADGRCAAVGAGALPVAVVDPGVPPDAGREGWLDGVVLEQQVVGVGPAAGSLFVTLESHDPREGAVNAVAGGGEVDDDGQGGDGARYGDDGAVGASADGAEIVEDVVEVGGASGVVVGIGPGDGGLEGVGWALGDRDAGGPVGTGVAAGAVFGHGTGLVSRLCAGGVRVL